MARTQGDSSMSNRALCILVASVLSAAASSGSAAQGSRSESTQDHARLEQKAARVDARLRGKTGALERVELQRQRREIDELIRRLEAGEAVDPAELDRIVGQIPVRRPAVGKH